VPREGDAQRSGIAWKVPEPGQVGQKRAQLLGGFPVGIGYLYLGPQPVSFALPEIVVRGGLQDLQVIVWSNHCSISFSHRNIAKGQDRGHLR
jgi:hypothetical protein